MCPRSEQLFTSFYLLCSLPLSLVFLFLFDSDLMHLFTVLLQDRGRQEEGSDGSWRVWCTEMKINLKGKRRKSHYRCSVLCVWHKGAVLKSKATFTFLSNHIFSSLPPSSCYSNVLYVMLLEMWTHWTHQCARYLHLCELKGKQIDLWLIMQRLHSSILK